MNAVDLLARVGLATTLGLLIGLERQWRSRMANLQTMALISMGSALFLILGAYAFDGHGDPTRVAANIVTGIGFLGGGVIFKQGLTVQGLNTAATMWATAAVGALAGAWEWRGAVAGAVIVVAGNTLLHPLAARMNDRKVQVHPEYAAPQSEDYVVEMVFHRDQEAGMRAAIVDAIDAMGFALTSITVEDVRMSEAMQLEARMHAPESDHAKVVATVRELTADTRVRSVRWSTVAAAA